MRKNIILTALVLFSALPVVAQKKQQKTELQREVTLYNPYKPSLPDVLKKSFLPDMTDTSKVRPDFNYEIRPKPFMPEYTRIIILLILLYYKYNNIINNQDTTTEIFL